MSLMRTLARVAVGVAAARGAQALISNRNSNRQTGGGLLGSLQNNRATGGLAGGLGGLLAGGSNSAQGGLGDLLGSLGGQGGSGGGLGSLLGAGAAGGGLGALLGGMGSNAARPEGDTPDFASRFNESLIDGEPKTAPTADEEASAGLMIQAMIMAMKSDGRIDAAERQTLMDQMNDASPEERLFVEEELAADRDVADFASGIPDNAGVKSQIYLMSLMAIDLDNRAEAEHLHALAQGLGLDRAQVNMIHDKAGVVSLYE